MSKPSATWEQWNVRLDPDLSADLRAHLASPLLVGLPKGAVSGFFTAALRAELAKQKRIDAKAIATSTPDFF